MIDLYQNKVINYIDLSKANVELTEQSWNWLKKNIGDYGIDWITVYNEIQHIELRFKLPEDRLLFCLIWL
jgi:hypothetical protein